MTFPLRTATRLLGLALLLLAVLPAARAQEAAACPPALHLPSADEAARAAEQARDRGLLWRISKGGHSSWLYGTIHVGRMEWMFPGPKVSAALQGSEVVAFELDSTDPALMARLQDGLARSAKDAAALAVPRELSARLAAQMRAACASSEMLAGLAPEMQAFTLATMAVRRDGLDPAYGVDLALAQFARRKGKVVVSLETPEQQLRLLHSRTARELRTGLDKMLRDLEDGHARRQLLRMAELWEQGRAGELARYREWCDCANTPDERASLKALLDDRNGPLAARVDKLHASGRTVFTAVGALHMVGPAALPTLMARRGYRVERIELP
jgi:uncharacterized protein